MSNEQTRQAFEVECLRYWGDRCPDMEFKDGIYISGQLALAWTFWQAATLAMQGNRQPLTEGGAKDAIANKMIEIQEILDETYNFATTSPRCQQNINAVSELIGDISDIASQKAALPPTATPQGKP